jgi:UDP-N-acetylglucosamine 1-carboxyvinyltransferase
MTRYRIEGGVPLRGTVTAATSKNAVLPIMAATLLTDEVCTLTDVPRISDVLIMGRALQHLGAEVEGLGSATLRICCRAAHATTPDADLVRRLRASVVLMAPLLARRGRVTIAQPGGDAIGRRDLDAHLDVFAALGARVAESPAGYSAQASALHGASIFLAEASVTATENAVMAATLAHGVTTLKHAACEPHVVDLCRFLTRMGARIDGIGSNVIRVEGVARLGGAAHAPISDHIDVGTFMVATALTGGDVTIHNALPETLEMVALTLRRMGVRIDPVGPRAIRVRAGHLLGARRITTDVWPGFPTDLASFLIVLATQATGTTLVHDWMYEGRLFFTGQLVEMGAGIVLCDPHRCVITGPTALRGRSVVSPDLRAGAAMTLAALAATGRSEIHDVDHIKRGYEHFVERLAALGARIEELA